MPHSSIKGQVLADFIVEFSNEPREELPQKAPWELFVDSWSTEDGSGAGIVIDSPDGRLFCEVLPFDFKALNNVAEYEALIARVRMEIGLGIPSLILHSNSQLVVS